MFSVIDQNRFDLDVRLDPNSQATQAPLQCENSQASKAVEQSDRQEQRSLFADHSLNWKEHQPQNASDARSHSALHDGLSMKVCKRTKCHGGFDNSMHEAQSESRLIVARKRFIGKQGHRNGKYKDAVQRGWVKRQR